MSTGFYVLEPESLDYLADNKWDFAKDFFPHLLGLHKKLSGFSSDAFWVDIGNLPGYLRGVEWILEKMSQPNNAISTGLPNPGMIDRTAQVGESSAGEWPFARRKGRRDRGYGEDRPVLRGQEECVRLHRQLSRPKHGDGEGIRGAQQRDNE